MHTVQHPRESLTKSHQIVPPEQPPTARQQHWTFPAAGIFVLALVLAITLGHRLQPRQEADWLNRLAQSGNAGAQLQLGLAYREGRYGLTPDPRTGLVWLQRAAEAGNAYAADLAGTAYAEGQGTDVDLDQARHWWQLAARGGNADAKRRLGEPIAASGPAGLDSLSAAADNLLVGTSNRGQSASALQQRANKGDPVAQYELAMRYRDGSWGVARDPALARQWLGRAAAAGNPLARQALSREQTSPDQH